MWSGTKSNYMERCRWTTYCWFNYFSCAYWLKSWITESNFKILKVPNLKSESSLTIPTKQWARIPINQWARIPTNQWARIPTNQWARNKVISNLLALIYQESSKYWFEPAIKDIWLNCLNTVQQLLKIQKNRSQKI